MAQGKMKVKKLPAGIKKKQKHQKKDLGPKKGARVIAPKKVKKVEAAKMEKALTKMINSTAEREVTLKAQSQEAKTFNLVKASEQNTASTSAKT